MYFDTVKRLCDENKITIAALEKIIGLSNGAIRKWDRSSPAVDKVLAVANYFGVTVDYLLTGKTSILSEDDAEFLKKWHELDADGKTIVQYIISAEMKRAADLAAKTTIVQYIPIRRSLQKASAGHGCYLGPEEFETVYVRDTPTTRRASFIVQVTGNSMEPVFTDGDQLLVERADDIEIGEIGVFTVDGDGYVKKRGKDCLVSLNPDYLPIPLNRNSWCNGRIIGKLSAGEIK